MLKKISFTILSLLLLFLGYVSTRESKFNYERSAVIHSSAEKIFPYISSLRLGIKWNPYNQKDSNIKLKFSGLDGTIGSKMDFEGNSEAGTGSVEVKKIIPNQSVEIQLIMMKPFVADNMIVYTLTPETNGTRFSWRMYGDGGFMGKILSVVIDCEKMIFNDFDKGILNLKNLVENNK